MKKNKLELIYFSERLETNVFFSVTVLIIINVIYIYFKINVMKQRASLISTKSVSLKLYSEH